MNVAARMGAWSAGHRKTAIIGWLVFVMAALVIGSSGTKQITNAEGSNGQSAKAEQILSSSGFPDAASENVLVQTKNGQPDDAGLRAAVAQVVAAVSSTKLVDNLHSPLDADGEPFVSHDGHSMLVTFDMTGNADTAESRVQPLLDAVATVQKANPSLRVEEVGDASGEKALDKTLGKDFKRAEMLSIPLTLGILLAVFGSLVAAIVPVGLALTAFMAAGGLLALTSRAVHIDGTARPQLVSQECQPFLWEVLRRYEQLTGAWALINTSFNMHEEPIVCGVDDALSAFFAAGLDVLVLGDWVITRDANADVAKGAALTRRGRPQERLRRAAQSASLGRLLHDLVAANDGVTVRHLDPDLYRGSRDQTSPDTGESGSGTHPSTSHMWEEPPREDDRATRGAGSIPAVKRVRPPLSPDWSPHV